MSRQVSTSTTNSPRKGTFGFIHHRFFHNALFLGFYKIYAHTHHVRSKLNKTLHCTGIILVLSLGLVCLPEGRWNLIFGLSPRNKSRTFTNRGSWCPRGFRTQITERKTPHPMSTQHSVYDTSNGSTVNIQKRRIVRKRRFEFIPRRMVEDNTYKFGKM